MSIGTSMSIVAFILIELSLKPTHTYATHALVVPAIAVAQVSDRLKEELEKAIVEPVQMAGLSIEPSGERAIKKLLDDNADKLHYV
jgi:hypothetical protein